MEVFVCAFVGSLVGVAVTLGGINILTTLISVWESRRQIEKLQLTIDNARKAGVPITYETFKN